jgi:dipeptidyl aminopeptidase/acylaminoacyl peptidase
VTRRTVALLALLVVTLPVGAQQPLTVAEKSEFKATARHAEVMDFCQELAKLSPVVRLSELGTSAQGRKLPLLILADPPVATPAQASARGRPIVLALGNIHGGEVDGKEALLMLARDLATRERARLKDLVVLIAPLINADGGEKIDRANRPEQNGPADGVGERANAQGFDLNRDYIKLETPEVRAVVRAIRQWDPALIIDTHTTNGSFHRYTITYDGPRNPAVEPELVKGVRAGLLPDVGRRLEKATGDRSFFYGNFVKGHTLWEPYPALPRYGTQYAGLRHRLGILVESYSYAPYKDRILATRAFVRGCLDYAAEHREGIRKFLAAGKPPDKIALRHKLAPLPKPVSLLGFVEEKKDGKRVSTGRPHTYEVEHLGLTEATLTVPRPYAYLLPAKYHTAVEILQRHGITLEELREDIELDVEAYRIDQIVRAPKQYQKHHLVSVQVTPRAESRMVRAGTVLVKTAQPLGTLAAYMLEPQAEDGLCTWNVFDAGLKEGQDFPVLRLPGREPITVGKVRPLPEERQLNKPIIFEAVYGSVPALNFTGNPVSRLTWLGDGEHFLQVKEGRLRKVHAPTGRSEPFHDPARLARGLAALSTIGSHTASTMAEGIGFTMNPQRTGSLFDHDNDLYFCKFDGSGGVRLTHTPGREELTSFSPDGKFVAFVRDHNLYVVDLATQTERALTTDGKGVISNGKADWVYFEEIFNRSWKAYWWAPDSKGLVFLRFDDTAVPKFTVVDHTQRQQKLEVTPYPKAGAPNPVVKLGVVSVGGGPVRWVDLAGYSETSSLVIRAGFLPDSSRVFFYVQDRAQTWLDFCTAARDGGAVRRLFRETTRAWVDDPGDPHFLRDGSFLLSSERSGYKHLYRFSKDGKLMGPVTSGPWESRTLHLVDEKSGWVYLSGTRDSALASNLYRVKLDGGEIERLTRAAGNHRVELAPGGKYFIDTWSDPETPPQVRLYHPDGKAARTIDTNPVHRREEYRHGKHEFVQIKTPDGFVLDGTLLKPANFDAKKRYPVWFMTYGGPHFPTVRNAWTGQRARDEALAHMGFLVFRCDPRSASGKGAVSTWTAYRQLGLQELKDIETAIRWLTKHPWVDPARVGMSGHSYGGFMTAYAMTHSKLFAAGIAGAPVTDWRNYDSIYTERYMNTPQENPKGYDATSVVKAAKNLHGKLLILHGLMDDNVHVQNTVELMQALQRADRDFEVMFYPRARHGLFGRHYQRLMVDFMKRTLRP